MKDELLDLISEEEIKAWIDTVINEDPKESPIYETVEKIMQENDICLSPKQLFLVGFFLAVQVLEAWENIHQPIMDIEILKRDFEEFTDEDLRELSKKFGIEEEEQELT